MPEEMKPTKLLLPRKPPVKWRAWLSAFLALLIVLVYFVYAYPNRNIGPEQPIPFSHRVHAGVKGINCKFCHPYVERSARAGLPTMEKCFYCHKYVIPLHPEILKEKNSLETRDPIRWVQVFYLPDHVKFKHQPHLLWGKLDCPQCHGAVQQEDRLKSVKFQMGFCIGCHKQKNAQIDCWLACHH